MKKTLWSADNDHDLFNLLVGQSFGDQPELNIDIIRQNKLEIAHYISNQLNLKKTDVVLDLGSGCGYLAKPISHLVEKVICCDISEDFLKYAKNECREVENIEFHLVQNYKLKPLLNSSLDAAYSFNVFIHLNTYQIYAYLKEMARVLKADSLFIFDIMSTDL